MSDEFDASAEAAKAVGAQADGNLEGAQESHAAAEGVDPSSDVGSSRALRDMLLSTEPSPRLEDLDDPWNPEAGGTARIMRAVMKATNIEGLPAIGDLLIGAVEVVVQLREELPDDQEADDEARAGGQAPAAETIDDKIADLEGEGA